MTDALKVAKRPKVAEQLLGRDKPAPPKKFSSYRATRDRTCDHFQSTVIRNRSKFAVDR